MGEEEKSPRNRWNHEVNTAGGGKREGKAGKGLRSNYGNGGQVNF